MARVLLVSANLAVEPYPVYPLGMSTVAAALADAGHVVEQYDPLVDGVWPDPLVEAVRRFAPDVVGVSIRNIDNVDSFSGEKKWWVADAKRAVEAIKSATSVPVFLGGAGFSLLPGPVLEYVGADHGVVGEGEVAAVELIRALTAGEAPPRLNWGKVRLTPDKFSPPLLVDRFLKFYEQRTGFANYQTKRGCPHRCAYCTYPNLEGNRFLFKESTLVVDQLEKMMTDHGVREVFFTDSVFNDAKGYYLELCEEMIRRNLGLRWAGFFRPKGFGVPEMELMKRAGLFAMELGTDAASDATMAAMDKGFTFADAERVNDAAVAVGIPAAHYVVFGGPGETDATVEEGLANMERLNRTVVFAFSGLRILPETKVASLAVAEGVISPEDDLLRPVFYHSPHIVPEAMHLRIKEGFAGRHDRVFPPGEYSSRLEVMSRFGFKGLLWDRLIAYAESRRAKAGRGR